MWSGVRGFFDFNRGAIDILVVRQDDGTLASTPFHVRFGKGQLSPEENKVEIAVNDTPIPVFMHVGEAGEAYFESKPETETEEEGTLQQQKKEEDAEKQAHPAQEAKEEAKEVKQAREEAKEEIAEGKLPKPPIDDANLLKEGKETSQQGSGWTWGWGVLPYKRNNKDSPSTSVSPSASPSLSSSMVELPEFESLTPSSSFPSSSTASSKQSSTTSLSSSGENKKDDTSSSSQPSKALAIPNNKEESAAAAKSSSPNMTQGSKKWDMGSFFRLFKKSGIEPYQEEPIYLIKPIDEELYYSMFEKDELENGGDKGGEDELIDEYFYSAMHSPREPSSPSPSHSFYRRNSLRGRSSSNGFNNFDDSSDSDDEGGSGFAFLRENEKEKEVVKEEKEEKNALLKMEEKCKDEVITETSNKGNDEKKENGFVQNGHSATSNEKREGKEKEEDITITDLEEKHDAEAKERREELLDEKLDHSCTEETQQQGKKESDENGVTQPYRIPVPLIPLNDEKREQHKSENNSKASTSDASHSMESECHWTVHELRQQLNGQSSKEIGHKSEKQQEEDKKERKEDKVEQEEEEISVDQIKIEMSLCGHLLPKWTTSSNQLTTPATTATNGTKNIPAVVSASSKGDVIAPSTSVEAKHNKIVSTVSPPAEKGAAPGDSKTESSSKAIAAPNSPPNSAAVSICAQNEVVTKDASKEGLDEIFRKHLVTYAEFSKNPSLLWNNNLVFKIQDKYYPQTIAAPLMISLLVFRRPLPRSVIEDLEKAYMAKSSSEVSGRKGWRGWWSSSASSSASSMTSVGDAVKAAPQKQAPIKSAKEEIAETRTLRPTSEQLVMMNLREGKNKITFSVRLGDVVTQEVTATIFLWGSDVKIVISDIDGTITKSDLFGHILPILGKDWSHSGVAQLYSNIYENGYKILYLSSRSIGQTNITRGFLSTLRQEDISLPEGPVFTAPNGLLTSVHREVIRRKPEEFKIACLKDISGLFPKRRPYYAGFGNRTSDVISYKAVGVPSGKIFTINQKGEITITNKAYKKSYMKLNDLVHEMFPSVGRPHVHEEFNNYQYWKPPLPELGDELEELD